MRRLPKGGGWSSGGLVIPGYEHGLRASHLFNLLDARGAVSVSDRPARILAVRGIALRAAARYLERMAEAP